MSQDYRDEAVAFLGWLERDHMTLLGYEYLQVRRPPAATLQYRADASLGLLRNCETRGVAGPAGRSCTIVARAVAHQAAQLFQVPAALPGPSARLSGLCAVKVFNDAGDVIGQHRFLGLYTSSVYTMDPQVDTHPAAQGGAGAGDVQHGSGGARIAGNWCASLQVFPRDELFQSSIEDLFAPRSMRSTASRRGGRRGCLCARMSTANSSTVSCISPRSLQH